MDNNHTADQNPIINKGETFEVKENITSKANKVINVGKIKPLITLSDSFLCQASAGPTAENKAKNN